ncbi:MAG TPA: cytochrome c [Gallionellaceae bacterium]|nr:cytochrome c [Gallionellaceae bacterium]
MRSLACAIALAGAFILEPAPANAQITAPDAARRLQLIRLVRNDCGSCHGMLLNGGLGPTLLPQALRDKPDASLVATILDGRNGTPMPPWRAFMTEAEAAWVVENLKQGFPDAQSK